jgi:hypothetical protein
MAGVIPMTGIVSPRESDPGPCFQASAASLRSGLVLAPSGQTPWLRKGAGVGFALRSAGAAAGEEAYQIVLLDRSGATLLAFGPYPEEDVVAVWRGLGFRSGLPLLIEHGGGDLRPAYDQLGCIRLGRTRSRGRLLQLSGRRPRFLGRRKVTRLPPQPLIVRGRQIVEGKGS